MSVSIRPTLRRLGILLAVLTAAFVAGLFCAYLHAPLAWTIGPMFTSADITLIFSQKAPPALLQMVGLMLTVAAIIYGLNYSDHAVEAGLPVPSEPILFNKSSATYCGPDDPILYSPRMSKLDWEVELGSVIGKPTLDIDRDQAMDHVAGFVLVNDVSERAWQMERGGQGSRARAFPISARPDPGW